MGEDISLLVAQFWLLAVSSSAVRIRSHQHIPAEALTGHLDHLTIRGSFYSCSGYARFDNGLVSLYNLEDYRYETSL